MASYNIRRMSNETAPKNFFSWKDNKVIVIALIIFLVLGLAYYFRRAAETPEDQVPQGITLTPEQEEELIKKMSAPPDSKPTLSEKEIKGLTKTMSAPKNSTLSISEDELDRLIQAMSAK